MVPAYETEAAVLEAALTAATDAPEDELPHATSRARAEAVALRRTSGAARGLRRMGVIEAAPGQWIGWTAPRWGSGKDK